MERGDYARLQARGSATDQRQRVTAHPDCSFVSQGPKLSIISVTRLLIAVTLAGKTAAAQ